MRLVVEGNRRDMLRYQLANSLLVSMVQGIAISVSQDHEHNRTVADSYVKFAFAIAEAVLGEGRVE